MNSDPPLNPRDEQEARLTALLLGELTEAEAAEVRQAMAQDAELTRLHEQLQRTIGLVREALASPDDAPAAQPAPLQLSAHRRQQLLQHFKMGIPASLAQPARRQVRWSIPVRIAAVLLVCFGLTVLILPNFIKARRAVSYSAALPERAERRMAVPSIAGELPAASDDTMPRQHWYVANGADPVANSMRRSGAAKVLDAKVGKDAKLDWDVAVVAPATSPQAAAGANIYLPASRSAGESLEEKPLIPPPAAVAVQPQDGVAALGGSFANTISASRPSKRGGLPIQLPMPTLKGTPDDLPKGPNIESIEETTRSATARLSLSTTDKDGNAQAVIQGGQALGDARAEQEAASPAVVAAAPATPPPPAPPPPSPPPSAPAATAVIQGGAQNRIVERGLLEYGSPFLLDQDQQNRQAARESLQLGLAESLGRASGTEPKLAEVDLGKRIVLIPGVRKPAVTGNARSDNTPSDLPVELTLDDQPVLGYHFRLAPLQAAIAGAPMVESPSESAHAAGGVVAAAADRSGVSYGIGRGIGGGGAGIALPEGSVKQAGSFELERQIKPNLELVANEKETRKKSESAIAGSSFAPDGQVNTGTATADSKVYSVNPAGYVNLSNLSSFTNSIEPSEAGQITLARADSSREAGGANANGRVNWFFKEEAQPAIERNIADSENSGATFLQSLALDPETLRRLETLRVESAADYDQLNTLYSRLTAMPPAELEKALVTATADKELAGLLGNLEARERQLARQSKTFGAGTAEAKQNQLLVEGTSKQVDSRVAAILELLKAKVDARKAKRDSLQAEREAGEKAVNKAIEDPAAKLSGTAPIPQPEVPTRDNAFSTFSLNVSDVSFKLAAASLEKGALPDLSTVRSEEFINAFDYRDPEPAPGQPIAFAWERTRYPFAHNRDLLRFSVQTAARGREPGRPLNLVLLLDNSGSMERADRVRIIQECLLVLAGQLQKPDRISVVTFARTARLWVDGVSGNQVGEAFGRVGTLTPEGGTNLEEAMNLAYQTARRHFLPNGVNRVVLLTDGAANLGDVNPAALKSQVEAHRKQGIALDCFGIGWEGYNDDLLEVLSRNGDGRYGFVNTPEDAASGFAGQLAGALQVAASDVKVQVEFNPRRTTAYRQIGYAKHQLKKEQFRDNTVDAAEIGAAESGNALYVVEANPAGEGPIGIVRVRYKVPGTSRYLEHEWTVPYTGPALPLEQASPAMRLAATASAFSEWLVASPHAAEVATDRLLGYLRGVPEVLGLDQRPQKLEWMIRQAQSIAGRR